MGCGLFKATAPRLRLVSDLTPTSSPPLRQFRLSSTMRSSPRCPLAALGRQSQEVPPPRWPRWYPSRPLLLLVRGSRPPRGPSDWSALLSLLQRAWRGGGAGGGCVGGPAASVLRSRPRPCLWCPRGGGGERDRPILPHPLSSLAARPPLAPTYP